MTSSSARLSTERAVRLRTRRARVESLRVGPQRAPPGTGAGSSRGATGTDQAFSPVLVQNARQCSASALMSGVSSTGFGAPRRAAASMALPIRSVVVTQRGKIAFQTG